MFQRFAIGGLAALMLTSAAFSDTSKTVGSIEVLLQIDAIENPEAAAYWTSLADDLENALAARLLGQMADDGINLKIDLEEVSLSGGITEKLGFADTRLIGDVVMTHATDNTRFGAYELTVDINSAMPMLPPDVDVTTLPADSRVYYDAMVATFADGVVERLQ